MNDAWIVFWIFVVVFVLMVTMASLRSKGIDSRELDLVAERWNGKVDRAGLFAFDEVLFWIEEAPARLHFSPREPSGRNTHVSIQFPDSDLRVEVYTPGAKRKLRGVEDIRVGNRDFDDAFVITGNHPEEIRAFLNDTARSAITRMAQLNKVFRAELHLSIGGGVLRITKHGANSYDGGLMRLLTHFEALYYALTSHYQPSIEFVSAKDAAVLQHTSLQNTQCQVCGEALGGKIVNCKSCQTPHHLDCWEYFGSCSVYGCGQKRYTHPKRTKG